MWKIIREILGLLWKLIRTLVRDKLRAILTRVLFFTFVFGIGIAVIIFLVIMAGRL